MSDVESFVRFCESDLGAAVMDREAAYLDQFLAPTDRVLDVGAGIGSIEERLPGKDIVGLDLSVEMVRTARARVDSQFLVGDARSLPVRNEAVDVVLFIATLEFISEIETVLSETIRVLDPNGILVALLLNTQSTYVRSNMQREGSYFQRIVHKDTVALSSTIGDFADIELEYFLGIDGKRVFETNDPEQAAILAVTGNPLP